MSQATIIINTLYNELSDTIVSNDTYNTSPIIKHGNYSYDKFSGDALCFVELSKSPMNVLGDEDTFGLALLVYGYSPMVGGAAGDSNIHDLCDDFLYFLENKFSLTTSVLYMKDPEFAIGNEDDMPIAMFRLNIIIQYAFNDATINK